MLGEGWTATDGCRENRITLKKILKQTHCLSDSECNVERDRSGELGGERINKVRIRRRR